ncbi:MAG: hypothetical protein ACOCYU_04380 [Brevefilum sp.]
MNKKTGKSPFGQRISDFLIRLIKSPAFYVYLVAVVIYLPWFFPNLNDIAPWDETYYIVSGKEILSGDLPGAFPGAFGRLRFAARCHYG